VNDSFAAPRKSLSQNFLQDQNIIYKIVASLNIQADDLVLEIGPGRGALTELILAACQDVHLVEYDRDLAAYWRQRGEQLPHLTLHEADFLKFDLQQGIDLTNRRIKVIGNLPYNISSPILIHLLKYTEWIDSQVVMLQKEVVDRICATPGNKQFGRLSVMLQYCYDVEYLFTVPATAFYPPPKVASAIARFTPKRSIERPVINIEDLEFIVKQAFSQRRKTLRNTLKGFINAEQIELLEICASDRAETLTVDNFVDLANLYTSSRELIT
jgi:16S rRNA (adenine1518-N6/adenine1519-N6)-dimethyltransferase